MRLNPEQIAQKKARLAELKQMQSNPELQKKDLLHRMAKSPVTQAILGAGDTFKNQTNALANLVTGGLIPNKPTKSGEGTAYDVGGYGLEFLQMLMPQTAIGRIAASSALGGLSNPEDPSQGVATGALFGVGGEAIGGALQGAGSLFRNKLIEPLSLDNKTAEISKKIQQGYESAKELAWGSIKPILARFGDKELVKRGAYGEANNSSDFMEFENLFGNDITKKLFTPDAKRLKEQFDLKPNVKNAQALIEKLGIDERKIQHSMDPTKELKAETYRDAKKLLRNTMTSTMEELSPGFTDLYRESNKKYAQYVGPYHSSDIIESAAAGNPEDLATLNQSIIDESKKQIKGFPGIGQGHELLNINKEAEHALGVSQMVPQGAQKFAPFLGTSKSRETTYQGVSKAEQALTPYLRALLQSQSANSGENANKPLEIEITKQVPRY